MADNTDRGDKQAIDGSGTAKNFSMENTYKHFTATDFAAEPAFIQWVLHPDAESTEFWEEWLRTHPEKYETLQSARQLVRSLSQDEDEVQEWELDEIWQHLTIARKKHQIKENIGSKIIPSGFLKSRQTLAVAAIGLLLLISIPVFFYVNYSSPIEYATDYGEKRTLKLPDGSVVILNAHSKITLPARWSPDSPRQVKLEGEAYFSVIHKADHQKFTILTSDGMQIEVLGTEFNVSDRDTISQVVLVSGKVRLYVANNDTYQQLDMRPGEMVEVSERTARLTSKTVQPEHYTAWKDNQFIFDNTPLQQIATMLEQNYGYPVVFQDTALADLKLTSSFEAKSLDHILVNLSETFGIRIAKDQDKILIGS